MHGSNVNLSGKYYKVIELLDMLHEITGKKKIKSILPLWFVKLTAPLSELYYKIRKQPPLFTSYSIQTLNTNAFFNNSKAKKMLGYTTRPLKQTLIDTMQWLKAEHRI
jgi:dihydroflavonol-4-reductase